MIAESIIKIIFAIELLVFIIIRQYFQKKYLKDESPISNFPIYLKLLIGLAVFFTVFVPLIFILTPILDTFTVNTGDTVRIIGAILYVFTILLMWWVLATLTINFDQKAEQRYVVKTGPYALVRHPMYTVFIVQTIAQTLLTSNLIILLSIPIMVLFLILRVNFEDQILINEFKEEYIEYKRSKKALIPKIW